MLHDLLPLTLLKSLSESLYNSVSFFIFVLKGVWMKVYQCIFSDISYFRQKNILILDSTTLHHGIVAFTLLVNNIYIYNLRKTLKIERSFQPDVLPLLIFLFILSYYSFSIQLILNIASKPFSFDKMLMIRDLFCLI